MRKIIFNRQSTFYHNVKVGDIISHAWQQFASWSCVVHGSFVFGEFSPGCVFATWSPGHRALARNQLAQMHCFAASNGKLAGMPSASCLRKLLMMRIPSIRSQVLMIFPSRLSWKWAKESFWRYNVRMTWETVTWSNWEANSDFTVNQDHFNIFQWFLQFISDLGVFQVRKSKWPLIPRSQMSCLWFPGRFHIRLLDRSVQQLPSFWLIYALVIQA